jgi:hypothetical protein
MARITDKRVIESLEQLALVEPTADASARAIDRARQVVVQQQSAKRRGPTVVVFMTAACAAAIAALLVPIWNHFQRGEEMPVAQAPPAAAGPASRGNIQALPGSMPESNEPGPSGHVPGSGPAGPAGPPVAGSKPPMASEPSRPIPAAKLRSQETDTPSDDEPGDEAAFDSLTVSFKAALSRKAPEQIRIDGDGSCLYVIDAQPARGTEPPRPGVVQKSQLAARRMAELERLLAKTDWLTAEGGEGRALHTDAAEVKITLVRDEKTKTITCLGQRPEPYRSLLWFLQGVAEQEFRFYQLTGGVARERDDACRTIRFEIEGLTGQSGRGLPYYDIDLRRFAAPMAKIVREPKEIPYEQVIAAIKLLAYVGAESEFEAIAKLQGDMTRNTVAESIADFGGERAVPVLARLAPSNGEALWGLVRLGEIAVPTLVRMIEPGTKRASDTSEQAVRAYIEHWNELPGPVDERIVAAAREALADVVKHGGRKEYYQAFLKLVESDAVPPPADLACRIDGRSVSAALPLRFVHGWYVVADGRIVEEHASPAPGSGAKYFDLRFEGQAIDDVVRLRTICRTTQITAGHFESADMKDEKDVEIPAGARFEVVYTVWSKHAQSNIVSPIRVTTQFRTLWEGHLIKDGRTLKRIVYVARVAKPDEPQEELWPPAAPAAPKGGPAPPPPVFNFRGVELTEELKLTDFATLNDLAVAGKNNAIKEQGGTPTGTSRTEVADKTGPDDAGCEFVVYRDSKLKLDYVQVLVRAPGLPLKVFWYGPLDDGRLKKPR